MTAAFSGLWKTFPDAVSTAAPVAICAVGFAVVYRTTRFFHFAHGAVLAWGAYFALLLGVGHGSSMSCAIALAVLLASLLGVLTEFTLYRPFRRRSASSLSLLLASLGFYVVLQNLISLFFGDDTKTLRSGVVEQGINVIGARITPIQITTICLTVVLVVAVAVWLKCSRVGKSIRAVASDAHLAQAVGIDSDRVILWVFAIGSALAGIAGILVALDVDMTPTMGLNPLMMAIVAVIIGGVDSIGGIVLGALLIGMAQQFGAYYLSSQWQDAIVFAILLLFLLFRPQGFFGRKVKKATV